jgi:AcrR family transcriptional regulator
MYLSVLNPVNHVHDTSLRYSERVPASLPARSASGLPFVRTRAEERDRAAREAVIASQRGRIIEGAVEAAALKGYAATTLGDIVARARVSRSTFYEHFTSKDDCLVAAIEVCATALNAQIAQAVSDADPDDPATAIEAMIDAYCRVTTAEPEFARVFFCEAPAAGPRARSARDAGIASVVAHIRHQHDRLRAASPELLPISDTQLEIVIDGIAEHTRRLLDRGEIAVLLAHAAEFSTACRRVLGLPPVPRPAPDAALSPGAASETTTTRSARRSPAAAPPPR